MTASLIGSGRVGSGRYFVDHYKNTANTAIFGQGLTYYNSCQYAAWYGPDNFVRVARRMAGSPDWATVMLPITLNLADSHNTIALGVSAVDGRLHVCAGQHNNPLSYTRTSAGALDSPQTTPWTTSLFESPSGDLTELEIGTTTYPTFTRKPNGELLFWYRNGHSTNGRLRLASYDGVGWTLLGEVTSSTGTYTATFNGGQSTSRNFYWAPPLYSDGKLHLIGTWREGNPSILCSPNSPIANHHVVYVYSEDDGITWKTNSGAVIATTGTNPIHVNMPGIHVDSTDTRFALQVPSMSTGPSGQIGYAASYVRGNITSNSCVDDEAERVAKAGEHPRFRDPTTGVWTPSTVELGTNNNVFCQYPTGRAGRGHLVFSPNGNANMFYSGFRVYSATQANGYHDWELTFDGPKYLNAFGEAHMDHSRVADGIVSFLYIEQAPAGSTSAPVCVRDFILS
jgi:hypothetical protein